MSAQTQSEPYGEESYSTMCECCERERPVDAQGWVIGHEGEDLCPQCVDDLRAEHQRVIDAMPERIGLCPEHAPEFYYPIRDGEGLMCPQCPLEMVVYTKAAAPAERPQEGERREG